MPMGFRVNHFSNVSLSTDKPVYQPGQILHTRLIAFGVNKKAIAGQPVILKILDPEETLVTINPDEVSQSLRVAHF